MDFYQHQDDARRRTGRLVLLMGLAVLGTVLAVYAATLVILRFVEPDQPATPLRLDVMAIVVPCVLGVVLVGSLFKLMELRGGGRSVAEALGGRLVQPHTRDVGERRLLNVVQEMALASGTPVPPVFLLPNEQGINAFAAGYSVNDAVIGVTRGCVDQLTRDELQGVIAHEFSHILHGDMRLNIKLIGIVHGILLIGLIGGGLLRSLRYAPRRTSRNGKGGGGILVLLLAGAALMLIGYIGTFFGQLIKAAVSRQREFLADASAVQYTRNPAGIAGALRRIGGYATGSRLAAPRAPEMSHLFFGQGTSMLFATHPPLAERIRRIDAGFTPPEAPRAARAHPDVTEQAALGFAGDPQPQHVEQAAGLLHRLPDALTDAATDPAGACALVLLLLTDPRESVRMKQRQAVERDADPNVAAQWRRLMMHSPSIAPEARLTLMDLAVPALRDLAPAQVKGMSRVVRAMIAADERVSLFEWVLAQALQQRLGGDATKPSHAPMTLTAAMQTLRDAAQRVGTGTIDPPELSRVSAALEALGHAAPAQKKQAVEAFAHAISTDGRVSVSEAELFRGVCIVLGVPMPPLLPGQRLV